MSYAKEVIHNFTCIFCSRYWSIALDHSGERHLINKELYCPWCGQSHTYLTDDDYR